MAQKYPRKCGTCRECCVHVGVEELDKKPGIPCEHLCAKGCSIYEKRPGGCRSFVCMWYQGQFSQRDKPNQTGVVCWMAYTGIMLDKDGNKCLTLYVSHRPGKKLNKKMFNWMLQVSYQYPAIVTPMKGNNPRYRSIYWQGKKVTDQVEVKEWYEDSNPS